MKKYHVTLTEPERDQLKATVAKRKVDSQALKRAYVLLAADENQPYWLKDEQIQKTYQVRLVSLGLNPEPDLAWLMIDSTVVRARQYPGGQKK